MEVYNTRFPGLELHVMSWRKRTSLSGESTYVYSLYTIHKELLVLKIQFITRSELKLRESKVTNLQDQLSNAGQTPGRRQSAVGVHKSEVTALVTDCLVTSTWFTGGRERAEDRGPGEEAVREGAGGQRPRGQALRGIIYIWNQEDFFR